jgi:hypothetical protein
MDRRYYRIVVEGEIGPRYAAAFEGMEICAANGETEITGPIIDQSHLHGPLGRIADLGLTLRSVSQPKTDPSPPREGMLEQRLCDEVAE